MLCDTKGFRMTIDPKATGKRIRQERINNGLSLEKASIDMNVSLEHLKKIETGHRSPSLDLILLIAGYYHVSVDYLLTGCFCTENLHMEIRRIIHDLQKLLNRLNEA